MTNATSSLHANSVLGRVSLGKRLTTTLTILAVLFALLVANLTLIMVVQANDYQNMPSNNHTMAKQAKVKRGTISSADGVVLAQSVETEDGTYERQYPAGDLASQVVGYYSQKYGTAGIENTYNDTLTGEQNYASWLDVLNAQAGITQPGNDLVLTIDTRIQRAAQDSLEGFTGACVVIDPKTGAILGMASSPTYDAADFEAVLNEAAGGTGTSALLNRATQSQYAPGSTFKIITLATALENNVASEDSVYASPGSMEIGGAAVTNFNGNSFGNITLEMATILSSNTVFAQLGVEMGSHMLVAGADKFGFDTSMDFDLPLAESRMADPDNMTEWETAWAAVGQPVGAESTTGPFTTVLEMGMVGCAIANDGSIMHPYLVEGVFNANGQRSFTASHNAFLQACSASVADRVTAVLEKVVTQGTGVAAQIYGVSVAGKTGTAETGKPADDSWFVGFAPADDPQVVVAIVLEEAGEGTVNGASRARDVIQATLEVEGVL